jgi:hypothetical protein
MPTPTAPDAAVCIWVIWDTSVWVGEEPIAYPDAPGGNLINHQATAKLTGVPKRIAYRVYPWTQRRFYRQVT